MSELIQPADRRLRRISIVVIAAAALLALIGVIAFQRWLNDVSAGLSHRDLVAHLRGMIALALAGSALCLAVLAMVCARMLRQLREQRRWPLAGSKVIRATRIRRDAETIPLIRWLTVAVVLLLVLALAGGLLSWRLYQLAGL